MTTHSTDATPFERLAAAVIVRLTERGLAASWEFPGTIVVLGDDAHVIAGDANAPRWGIDLYRDGDYVDSIAGPTIGAADDARHADLMARVIGAALELAEGADPQSAGFGPRMGIELADTPSGGMEAVPMDDPEGDA